MCELYFNKAVIFKRDFSHILIEGYVFIVCRERKGERSISVREEH